MDHEHMHNDAGLGMDYNYAFARDYWYILAGAVGAFTAARMVNFCAGKQRYEAQSPKSKNDRRIMLTSTKRVAD